MVLASIASSPPTKSSTHPLAPRSWPRVSTYLYPSENNTWRSSQWQCTPRTCNAYCCSCWRIARAAAYVPRRPKMRDHHYAAALGIRPKVSAMAPDYGRRRCACAWGAAHPSPRWQPRKRRLPQASVASAESPGPLQVSCGPGPLQVSCWPTSGPGDPTSQPPGHRRDARRLPLLRTPRASIASRRTVGGLRFRQQRCLNREKATEVRRPGAPG